jgi:hypothetical protein
VSLLWQVNNSSKPMIGVVFTIIIFIMVVIVEKMINTTYTITTDEKLIIHNGRFSKDICIDVDDIKKIDKICRWKIGNKALMTYLLIITKDEHEIPVNPENEEDFVKKITKIKLKNNQDEDDED